VRYRLKVNMVLFFVLGVEGLASSAMVLIVELTGESSTSFMIRKHLVRTW
jgi:hypothetical protein